MRRLRPGRGGCCDRHPGAVAGTRFPSPSPTMPITCCRHKRRPWTQSYLANVLLAKHAARTALPARLVHYSDSPRVLGNRCRTTVVTRKCIHKRCRRQAQRQQLTHNLSLVLLSWLLLNVTDAVPSTGSVTQDKCVHLVAKCTSCLYCTCLYMTKSAVARCWSLAPDMPCRHPGSVLIAY